MTQFRRLAAFLTASLMIGATLALAVCVTPADITAKVGTVSTAWGMETAAQNRGRFIHKCIKNLLGDAAQGTAHLDSDDVEQQFSNLNGGDAAWQKVELDSLTLDQQRQRVARVQQWASEGEIVVAFWRRTGQPTRILLLVPGPAVPSGMTNTNWPNFALPHCAVAQDTNMGETGVSSPDVPLTDGIGLMDSEPREVTFYRYRY